MSTGRNGAAVTPIEVRVPTQREPVPGGGATVGGMPVVAGTGESVQEAVLNHLHRLTLATGHPVLATVHDERIGYVIPLRIHVDGSSTYAGQPERFAAVVPAPAPASAPAPAPVTAPGPRRDKATHALRAVEERAVRDRAASAPAAAAAPAIAPAIAPAEPAVAAQGPADGARQDEDGRAEEARSEAASAGHTVATFMLRAVPEQAPLITTTASGLAQDLSAGPVAPASSPQPPVPGTVQPPRGEFGPPPVTSAPNPAPAPAPAPAPEPTSAAAPAAPAPKPAPVTPDPASDPEFSAPAWKPTPAPRTVPVEEVKEPPVREFDSVVDVVLEPDPGNPPSASDGPFAAPMARIGEAVRQGRVDEAAALAEETVAEATETHGTEHPEVLRLRELTAYIAYLAGDPLRSFHLSLDLARLHHRLHDARAAYGNVQSAAAAWRAVRDPLQGLHLGRDLIGTWTELAAHEGPAADDLEQLESARNRMTRLAERARALDEER
ncbi:MULTISPECIES: tetratricopeptide repeat protein [unclassified Streptomyces]|uniref:tetratricopeptide repeat protein n=1 Tax=unclassified Streptomyces TaxID=2593676 RepID=UPI000A80A499|nr:MULTISPECIES: tetratricopeptide repeat protein [unclassified Streptomyces]